jgi:hypothetical protein
MPMLAEQPSVTRLAYEKLESVDLAPVRRKLEQQGWSPGLTREVEPEYRRMLALMASRTGRPLAPSALIDEFWHAHILHTKSYARDCEVAFGRFVHHEPATDEHRDDDDLRRCFRETLRAYRNEFGEPPHEVWGLAADCNDDATSCTSNPNDCTGSTPGCSDEK